MNPHRFSRRRLLKAAGGAAAFASAGGAGAILAALAQDAPGSRANLIVRSMSPQDLETPIGQISSWITPNESFFVRSHLPTPRVDPAAWRLNVAGAVERPLALRLADLEALPRATDVVTLECAGNGRAFFDPPVAGVQWRKGAVGNARWTGVRLADVLNRAGVRTSGRFVALDGADRSIGSVPDFVRNVPMAKAMHPDTLLAYEMNGQRLPSSHGFPLRVIVPGWEGAYSVKWLTDIEVLEREHDGFFVQTGYRYPTRSVEPGETVDPKDMEPLTGLPVKSILTSPADGSQIGSGRVLVAGFAWAGEADVARVDISTDGGREWVPASLGKDQARYAWRRFEYEWNVNRAGSYEVMSRASDSAGRTQPLVARWNPSGYLWNAIDRVAVSTESRAAGREMPSTGNRLPEGPAAALVQQKCTNCHGPDLITQQRLSQTGWTREVDKMLRWGADLSPDERTRIIDYLAGQFPPR